MAELSLDCAACGKKFRVNFAVKPKQVACPQCKARISTSADTPGAPDTTAARPPTDGAGDGKPAAPKARRLPVLLRTEGVEFRDWTYDREAEQSRGGLQKADVLGLLWIAGVLLMVGFILSRLLRKAPWAGGAVMILGGIGMLGVAYLVWKLRAKGDLSVCPRCKGKWQEVSTLPSAEECAGGGYTRGASGSAYKLSDGKFWEVRRKWHACTPCRRYFRAEKEALDFVGPARTDIDKRETLYAEAAAAVAAAKPPASADAKQEAV